MNCSDKDKGGFGPLSDLKILDFTGLLPGPFATWHLADLGAQVLRILHPSREDLLLAHKPKLFELFHRGKDSLRLDLKKEDSIVQIKTLIGEGYNTLLEGFRPGTMDRLGLGYELLSSEFPELIYCSLSAFPSSSNKAQFAGHDLNHYSLSGLQDLWRHKGKKAPLPATPLADSMAGLHCALGIVSAAYERTRSAQGQQIHVNLMESVDTLAQLASCDANEEEAMQPSSDLLTGASSYNLYETKDGRYMAQAALEPHFLKRILDLMKLEASLLTKPEKLHKAFADRFLEESFHYWRELFENEDVCVSPVLNTKEATLRLKEQGSLIQVDGKWQMRGPVRMSRTQKESYVL